MNPVRNEKGVVIPHHKLSSEALQGLLEEFVSRDGTDSGYTKLSLQQRVDQVRRQLDGGDAVIVYDETTQTANIVSNQDIKNSPDR
jgi:uncharacterized protein YheU (UPF0270 family)